MAIAYISLTAAADPQAVCTAFEAEANITSCTIAGLAGEADTSRLFPDVVAKYLLTINNTGGTFDIGATGDLEAAVAFNATSATIQAALRALDSFGDTLTVTGDGPHVITMAADDPTLIIDITNMTGGTDSTLVETQDDRDGEVLANPAAGIFKVVGTTVAAIDAAVTAVGGCEEASGYPEAAI